MDVPSLHPVLLCFQPGFSSKLIHIGARKLILVDSAPQRKHPTGRRTSPIRHFVRDLMRFYDGQGFTLLTAEKCTPSGRTGHKVSATIESGCCGCREPNKTLDDDPWRFLLSNGSMEIAHYVASGYPHSMSVELDDELQQSTGLVVSRNWLPPTAILNIFDDPIPRNLYIDAVLRARACPHSIVNHSNGMGAVWYLNL
jgi:hypothetical protein